MTATSPAPAPPQQGIARAVNVYKVYGTGEAEVRALDGINVDFAGAQFTAIMGPSGSGKSTLLHCLAGLDRVTSGQIWLGDIEISGSNEKQLTLIRRDRIGFVFQAYNLIPTLNAEENITLPMALAGNKPDPAWFNQIVETVRLTDRLKHRPNELSGGQQQRVAVARALVSRPDLMFADEPTGNLDSRSGAEILTFMRDAVNNLGQTIVMVTHDPIAAGYADRVVFLADGRIVDEMLQPTADRVLDRMKSLGEQLRMVRVTLKGILAHKVRFVLTGVAVILGVAFISGTLVFTATINKAFDGLFTNIYANTDAVVRQKEAFSAETGPARGRIDRSLVPKVRATEGVAEADGTLQGFAWVVKRDGTVLNKTTQGPPALGFAWIESRDLSPFHLIDGHGPESANQVVMDKATAEKSNYKLGDDDVRVSAGTGVKEYELVGIAEFGDADGLLGATSVLFTPATANSVFQADGKVDEIGVKSESGVSEPDLVRNIRQTLSGQKNIEVLSGSEITTESQNDVKEQLGFFNTFLLVFGVIALLVGSFIIFNTFGIIIAQRSREMALLRAIGAKGGQVIWSVLFEALLVGVVASILGFVAGVLLASAVKAVLAATGVDLPTAGITVPPSALITSLVVGILVTVVAAVFPAIRASRIPPIAALQRVGADESAGSWKRITSGVVITLVGIGLLVSGLSSEALPTVGLGAFVVFIGVAILGPTIARPISAVLGWPIKSVKGITGLLAEENAKRNPKRTSATAAALMIGVALVCLITIFGASARASVRSGIDQSMKADYLVNSGGFGFGTIPRTLETALRETPGVEQVSGTQFGPIKVGTSVNNALGVDPAVVDSLFDLKVSDGSLKTLGVDGLAVQKDTAEDKNLKVGDDVKVLFPQGNPRTFTVRAIFDQSSVPSIPAYVISTDAFVANYPNVFDLAVYIQTQGGPTPQNRAALEKTMKQFPVGELQDRDQFKAAQSAQIEGFLTFVTALLLFAVLIAVFGIANTLGLSIIERTRELGLMRAVGMTRRQVRSLVRWESVIIALLGAILGIVIGVGFGWVIVSALSSEGISEFRAAPARLVVIFLIAAVFGIIAAILPARRAAKLDVLQAISTE